MDHRCLYGHRVPKDFAWVIQQRVCPVCGAPSVSTSGYQLARRLANELSIEAMSAFNTVRMLEEDYVLFPRDQLPDSPEASADAGFEDLPTTSEAVSAGVEPEAFGVALMGEATDKSFPEAPPLSPTVPHGSPSVSPTPEA